ncbi:hypothetical protein BCR35DRAFT_356118 [Leucosporidium creatinivorum]|uniref:PWWP domain-containing protein n=1 Tax=Leucosporidium creatinivorum TaxID=106004 RepID=A0A1Y2CV44_9BASI|nr:hypothetical protein BCR35DRAFT_356118 [Leucosporidium creatinivorum]
MDVEAVAETPPPRASPSLSTTTAPSDSTAPPQLAPLSAAPAAQSLPFAFENVLGTAKDASAALLEQPSTKADALQDEESVVALTSDASMTGAQGTRALASRSSLLDATPQPGSSFLSELPLDELERAHAAGRDAPVEQAEATAGDGVQQGSTSSFHLYRDTKVPQSSFQTEARLPSSDPIASPAIPLPPPTQPIHSTPPHPSSSSSSVNPTPVLRGKVPPAHKKTVASTSSAFRSNPSQDLSDDSPDPMRIMPAPSAASTIRSTVVSKMKGKRQAGAPSRSTSVEAPSTTNGGRSSSPRATASTTNSREKKGAAKGSRLGGATSALDGAEETTGYAGRITGLDAMDEDEEVGDDSVPLKESSEVVSDSAVEVKGKKSTKGSRRSSPNGSSSVARPSHTFELDIVVGTSSRKRSAAASPTVDRAMPSSSHPALPSSQTRPSSPPSLAPSEDEATTTSKRINSRPTAASKIAAVETSRSSAPSSPDADSDAKPRSAPKKGKGKPRKSLPELDFIVETATRFNLAIPTPTPPIDDPAPHPSSDLSSLADTMLASSPDREAVKRSRPALKDAAPSSEGASPKKKRRVPQAASQQQAKEVEPTAEDDEEAATGVKPIQDALSQSGVAAEEKWDVFSSPKRRRAVKAPIKDYSSSEDEASSEEEAEATPKKKARKVVESKGKGKGKAKEVEKAVKPKPKPRQSVATPNSSPKSALPSPSKMLFGSQPTSSFVQQLAVKAVAPRETPEQRAKGWALGRMDKLVWVRVEKEEVQFWWPGDITNALRSERPLKIALLLDDSKEILAFAPSNEVIIAEPDHTNILAFRTGAKIRFDRELFLENSEASSDSTPSPELFDTILKQAVELEALRGMEDDEEELPSSLPAPRKKGPGSPLKKGSKVETESEEGDPSSEEVEEEEEEEQDELLRDEDESAGFTYPSIVLAKSSRQWWGARLLNYQPPAKGAKGKGGKKAEGKFVVEWVDGSVSEVGKEDILTSSQPAFFTVKMGTTHLELPRDYVETLVEFAQDLHPTYQRIIDEDYPPATSWSDQFYKGGKARDALAKKARFGELRDEHTEALQKEITTWASGADGPRRTGSTRYEELSDAERSRYQADILLPLTVFHVIIHEHDFEVKAKDQLFEEGNAIPTEDDIMVKAFALADDEFDRGSIQKSILSARSAKQAADESRGRRR